MKKFVLIVFILTFFLLIAPSQSYAAWWNPISWFSKKNQIEEQKAEETTISELQTRGVNNKAEKKQSPVVPTTNPQSELKTIEDLRAEVATLKTSLDNLYKAHNNLVNDHNALLEYTKSIAGRKPALGSSNSDLEKRISVLNLTVEELDNKLTNICRQIFSSPIGTPSQVCPSSLPIGVSTLESRIRKLEGGY
jgi:hypothetical protein